MDPWASKYPYVTPYNFVENNPVMAIDPDGMRVDWVDRDGEIVWDDNVTGANDADLQDGDIYLGKNVLVATHNRGSDGNEAVNSATFDLYLESDKTGPSATIEGNTVPADINDYGTLAEGVYPAQYSVYKGDGAILIGGGGDLPTVNGNPNNPQNYNADGSLKPTSEHIMDEIFFHKGNYGRPSLSTSSGDPITEGCQTGPHGDGSLARYRQFISNAVGFSGSFYLRSKPTNIGNRNVNKHHNSKFDYF